MKNSYRLGKVFPSRMTAVVYTGDFYKGVFREHASRRCLLMPPGAGAVGSRDVPGKAPIQENQIIHLMGGTIPPVRVCMVFCQNYNRPIGRPVPVATVLVRAQSWGNDIGKLVCRKWPCLNDLTCCYAA